MTRIAVVTADLTPGSGGIADHSRVIAGALRAGGAEAALLSLADRAADLDSPAERRLPAALPWPRRIDLARRFLDARGTGGAILQLGPYLYDPKGLLQRVAEPLSAVLAGRRLAVVLHETWVGELAMHRWRDRLIGRLQRRGLEGLLRRLAPAGTFVSLPLYREQLARRGVAAALLPLPGNLPVAPTPAGAWLAERFAAAGLDLGDPALAVAGIFGGHWPRWSPEPALGRFVAAALAAGRRPVLLLIGRHGSPPARLEAWRRRHPRLAVVETGERPAAQLSGTVNSVHCALAVTPWELAGKSGSLAALLEHGVPTLATWGDPRRDPGLPADRRDLLLPPGSDPAPLLDRRPGSGPWRPLAPAVAARLREALAASAARG